ncbi:hypothetical protein F8M41_007007 [Gigaspora margarita]|uniref:Uncharacterized protein n=1 Tax=Gigaspora margarita TaxID=4874 RepID=A0A8H3X723_GIGMA|nr:hypothetical protein F8M41_007007 [Gigaspora margarita]
MNNFIIYLLYISFLISLIHSLDNDVKVDSNFYNNKLIKRVPQGKAPTVAPQATIPPQATTPPQVTTPAQPPPSVSSPAIQASGASNPTQISTNQPPIQPSTTPAPLAPTPLAPTPAAQPSTNTPQPPGAASQGPSPAEPYVPPPSPQIPTQLPYGVVGAAEKLRSEKRNVGMVALGITIFLVVIW